MQNLRNNDHILFLNNKIQRQKMNKSIKLGSVYREKKNILTPASKVTLANSQQILSSVSRKLQPQNIETLSRNNLNSAMVERNQVQIGCMVDFDSVSLMSFISQKTQISFSDMLRKAKKQNKQQLIVDIHENKKDRKGCFEINCNIKKKWLKNIVFYERELKNLMILKQKLPFINKNVLEQINKDIGRSFPESMFPKKKLTIYHAASEKVCMLQALKIVLKLYSIFDQEISYIQGINLVAATIIIHMKEIEPSFIFLKELMNYGKLRNFYLKDFQLLKNQSHVFYENYLKNNIYQLYDHFIQYNVEPLAIVPCYYTCLFSSIIDINYMHIVIDQYFMQGVVFLHKLYLSLLLYLKNDLLNSDEETLIKLGNTHLKSLKLPWDEILIVAEQFKQF